jgi:hypothetical protein
LDSVGGTPTVATETVALPFPSLRIRVAERRGFFPVVAQTF